MVRIILQRCSALSARRLLRGYENRLAALHAVQLAGEGGFDFAFRHLRQCIERGPCVRWGALPFVESKIVTVPVGFLRFRDSQSGRPGSSRDRRLWPLPLRVLLDSVLCLVA